MKTKSERQCRPADLVAFHYRDLDEAGCLAVMQHLARCDGCRRELAAIEQTLGEATMPVLQMSEAEVQRFTERVVASSRRSPWGRMAWGAALATAAAVFLFLYQPQGEIASPPPHLMVVELELLENLDLLQEMDLLESWDGRRAPEAQG